MDFSTLQTETRAKLVEPTAKFFTDVEIKRWLNLAYKDFIQKTGWTHRVKAYGVTANQYEYTLPSDYLHAEEFVWQDKYKIYLADIDEMREIIGQSPTNESTRPKAVLCHPWDRRFRIYPAASAASSATAVNVGGGINSSVTTITVDSTSGFPSKGRLIIENEQVIYYDTTATTFLQCVRGADDTTAASHADDVAVTEGELLLGYRYVPSDLSASSDTPKFPEIYHEALTYYAAHIGLIKQAQWKESQAMLGEYRDIVEVAILARQREQMDRHWYIKDEDNYPGIYSYGVY